MNKFQVALLSAAAAAVVAIPAALQHRASLRTENRQLRHQLEQLEAAAAETEQAIHHTPEVQVESSRQVDFEDSRGVSPELLRLRGQIARLRYELSEMDNPSNIYWLSSNAQVQIHRQAVRDGLILTEEEFKAGFPKESWAFAGYETPKAAMQSLFWALSEGDANTLFQSLSPDHLQWRLQHDWQGKTASEIAEKAKEQMKQITEIRMSGQMFLPKGGTDRLIFMLQLQGETVTRRSATVQVVRIGDEWKCEHNILAGFNVPPPQTGP